MAIKFVIDVEGPVALAETAEDFYEAIAKLDYPIIVSPEVADALGLNGVPDDPEVIADLLEDSPYEQDLARWTSFGSEAVH